MARLLKNSVRWLLNDEAPVTIQGDEIIEAFAWETDTGFAVHILNYKNPTMHRGWVREFFPIGVQKVRIKFPSARRAKRIELPHAETDIPFHIVNGSLEFTVS